MKTRAKLAAMLLLMSMSSAFATVRIYDDRGGQIGEYLSKFHALRVSGEQAVINSACASAWTMLLGTILRNRICVTPRAVLEFRAAWDPTPTGQAVSSAGDHLYCGRATIPACASGSAGTADCTRG
jgi:hypothetical protein